LADLKTVLLSAFSGGSSSSRHGDFVVVKFPATTFAASAMDFHLVRTWARGRSSLGSPQRDRVAFIERFETLLARGGSGVATKGNRPALRLLVRGLTQVGAVIGEWSVPHNLDESMEAQRRAPNTTAAD
jgi:hypothetical protein